MTAYADYTYYSGTYLGTAIASANFPRLALRASEVIDEITFGRAATDTDNETAIKNATCAVAEEIQRVEAGGNTDGIASESIGSNSVTYTANAYAQLSRLAKLSSAAKTYLGNTGLMFKGFADGEYGVLTDAN
jgi:hypothetical protein